MPDLLPIAFRCWTGTKDAPPKPSDNRPSERALIFDTETTDDTRQKLLFGFARLESYVWKMKEGFWSCIRRVCEAEICFCHDDLKLFDPLGYKVLKDWCERHSIELISRTEFAEQYVLKYAVNGRPPAVIVGFNLPFDLSRIAYDSGESKGKDSERGFSLRMFPEVPACVSDCHKEHKHRSQPQAEIPACGTGCMRRHRHRKTSQPEIPACLPDCHQIHNHLSEPQESRYRPRIFVKHLDSKKALISWRPYAEQKEPSGNFLDLRQLIWGLTNEATSLAVAGEMFGLKIRKVQAEQYGVIDEQFVTYARQDTATTAELYVTVLEKYLRHPIDVAAHKVYSPASGGKGYLRKMKLTPMLEREGFKLSDEVMGWTTATFYGGLSGGNIRRQPVPIALVDFVNMYGTINTLMHLWDFWTAERVVMTDNSQLVSQWTEFLTQVAHEGSSTLLDPSVWPSFVGIGQIIPDEDILPIRARYGGQSWNLGHNYLRAPSDKVWYALPDLIASALLTGKVPNLKRVIAFSPSGKLPGLETVRFDGEVPIDPYKDDLFKFLIEHRAELKAQSGTSWLTDQLKVLVNAPAYGITVETLRSEEPPGEITVYGQEDGPWNCSPNATEKAREFTYPPIGAAITSGARLMLSILEKLITDAEGKWAFRDTDSTAIVTSTDGSFPGSLTRKQSLTVRTKFNRLNPFNLQLVPQLLKDETEKTNESGQVYSFVISSKRYCLFEYVNGRPVIPEEIDGKTAYMRHGLGLYMNPSYGSLEDTNWIRQSWQWILDMAHDYKGSELTRKMLDGEGMPSWARYPAIVQTTVSTPHIMRSLKRWNEGKPYDERVKPFGFILLVSEYLQEGDNLYVGRERKPRRFITGYSRDPEKWISQDWYDLHNPDASPVKLGQDFQVKTHSDVLFSYAFHPEITSAQADGKTCRGMYEGELYRRHISPYSVHHIGKESNKLDAQLEGSIVSADEVYTTYPRDDRRVIIEALSTLTLEKIAELVNEELRYAPGMARADRLSKKDVERYLAGSKFRSAERGERLRAGNRVKALVMVAARNIASEVGIELKQIHSRNGVGMTPEKVLAIWWNMGRMTGITVGKRE